MQNTFNYRTLKIIENTPIIETKRLILRKFTYEDINDVMLIYGDEEVNKYLPWYTFKSLEEAKNKIDEYISFYTKPFGYKYAVCLKEDNRAIGYIHIAENESFDLGYALTKKNWNKGIITEAARVLLDKMKYVGFTYVTATHDINNIQSASVMKKIGMKYKYSYVELCEPKHIETVFRMYQINFIENDESVYIEYWSKYYRHFIEKDI